MAGIRPGEFSDYVAWRAFGSNADYYRAAGKDGKAEHAARRQREVRASIIRIAADATDLTEGELREVLNG